MQPTVQHWVATESIVPLRAEARHASELVSQLLLFEPVIILEEQEEWLKVQSTLDQYVGWAPRPMLYPSQLAYTEQFAGPAVQTISRGGHSMLLYAGSPVPQGAQLAIGPHQYDLTEVNTQAAAPTDWLNAPYLWGGKTLAGIDCSSFAQLLLRQRGTPLPRDAYQQAELGTEVPYGEQQAGDLAYFHNDKGRITHVGYMLDTDRIIHASHRVRIDTLTAAGIFAEEYQKRTHELTFIKRI